MSNNGKATLASVWYKIGLPKNIGTTAVHTDTNDPIIINFLKSIGKLINTSLTSKARNIRIKAELKIRPPINPPPGLLCPAKKT